MGTRWKAYEQGIAGRAGTELRKTGRGWTIRTRTAADACAGRPPTRVGRRRDRPCAHGAGADFFECELHRLRASCPPRETDEGETRLRKALGLARAQRSPSLELRIALSLANHLRAEGGTNEAEELIAGVYSTFTEGFETHDLVAARELLGRLQDPRAQLKPKPPSSRQ
jgi:hypothetical protein